MELVLGAAFLVVARAYAEAALYMTAKVIDLVNIEVKILKYATSAGVSGLMVIVTKYVGVGSVWTLLRILGFTDGAPALPDDVVIPNFYWFALAGLTWLYAGGLYDWKKKLPPPAAL